MIVHAGRNPRPITDLALFVSCLSESNVDVAEKVGVQSLRRLLLDATSQGLGLEVPGAEAFGQVSVVMLRVCCVTNCCPVRMLRGCGTMRSFAGTDVLFNSWIAVVVGCAPQSESITRRLHNILALYPEGPGVLYELLQNADDAKARLDLSALSQSSSLRCACSWQ